MMGADEEGTLERLKALRHELIDPKIVYGGDFSVYVGRFTELTIF
jgi:hypothetical protein